jgi:arabinose-5-phosphate isomerase
LVNSSDIKQLAIDTILLEANSIKNLANDIDETFVEVVDLIYNGAGRVIVTGIGKSAIVAGKIVATLNSTGTPAIFMHAADAIHGDLGIIQPEDVIICLSKSGNTAEIKVLVPLIKHMGNKLIAIVSNTDSLLAQQADYVIKAFVEKEACPNNLAPTTSTTAQMVIGDALAICLLKRRGFSSEDFARFHPGGSLGKKLYLRVGDFYLENRLPAVRLHDPLRKVIVEISSKRLGATAVIDEKGLLAGIITDGDLRRMLEKNVSIEKLTAGEIMSKNPKTIERNALAIDAFNTMKQNNITQLLIMDGQEYVGIIHLHDILKEGVV